MLHAIREKTEFGSHRDVLDVCGVIVKKFAVQFPLSLSFWVTLLDDSFFIEESLVSHCFRQSYGAPLRYTKLQASGFLSPAFLNILYTFFLKNAWQT